MQMPFASLLRNQAMKMVALGFMVFTATSPAQAELVLSKVIVDLRPDEPAREDIEIWNDSGERMYVAVEPSEILAPGTNKEERRPDLRPDQSGLLVTPQKLVLEPRQRRIVRIAAIAPREQTDKVYRVTVKPIAGPLNTSQSALKILVGYDVLVIYRPRDISSNIVAERDGNSLTVTNHGNTAIELFDGKQCSTASNKCSDLPSRRLYAGNTWKLTLPFDAPFTYTVSTGNDAKVLKFQ